MSLKERVEAMSERQAKDELYMLLSLYRAKLDSHYSELEEAKKKWENERELRLEIERLTGDYDSEAHPEHI